MLKMSLKLPQSRVVGDSASRPLYEVPSVICNTPILKLGPPCKCSHSNYSRDKFLDLFRLRGPSVRLTPSSGSAINTDSTENIVG
jgi:hypothetical protein